MICLRRFLPVISALICTALLCFAALPARAESNPRYASIVMDADTGMILHQSNADKALHPASLVKMMTLAMTFEALDSGKLRLRDRITVSPHAASMVPSKLGLTPGSTITVEDAIYALVTKSANDIAVALGERLGGTETQFASLMTSRARSIGMTRTTFRNASGLHNPGQVSTARDMAKLARYLIKTYPQYYTYFSTREFSYRGASYHNHNRLMDTFKGMDGLKTGFIGQSGFNLVASAVRNNHRLIGVVFGGRTAASRNAHMASLLNAGFDQVTDIRVAAAPVPARKPANIQPETITQLAANLMDTSPAAGDSANGGVDPAEEAAEEARFAALNPIMQNRTFSTLIGEGDSDPAVSRRLETGLKAIAAIRGEQHGDTTGIQIASLGTVATAPTTPQARPWAIQIGAFESRVRTDAALRTAMAKLPDGLSQGTPFIAPLKTGNGWLFRARLGGYTKEQAMAACKALKDCLPVAPQAY